jgi:hypothetical protein
VLRTGSIGIVCKTLWNGWSYPSRIRRKIKKKVQVS